jgi:hypothetical protein
MAISDESHINRVHVTNVICISSIAIKVLGRIVLSPCSTNRLEDWADRLVLLLSYDIFIIPVTRRLTLV